MDTIRENVREKSKETEGIPFLNDEIVINIVSRLPAQSVVTCQLVCKTWRDLTLSPYFTGLHLRNSVPSVPTILVSRATIHFGLHLFALYNWWEHDETMLTKHGFPNYSAGKFTKASRVESSYDGLIVINEHKHASFSKKENKHASSEAKFIILNPLRPSHECVTIKLPKELYNSQMYGVYFHPLLNEYCALLEMQESPGPFWNPQKIKTEYKVLNLGSNPSLKSIGNPCGGRLKLGYAKPLLINNYLYWLIENEQGYTGQGRRYGGRNDVMKFDTISEVFTVIPCPVPLNTECRPQNTRLLNIDGVLSFILIFSRKITLWRLEDHVEQLWTATEYTVRNNVEGGFFWEAVGGIAVVDGKLAILSRKILYVCDLREGTVKIVPKDLLEVKVESSQKRKYSGDAIYSSHQMSLASLKNCTSTIFINKDGEVAQMNKSPISGSCNIME